jgi:hypothetical protein
MNKYFIATIVASLIAAVFTLLFSFTTRTERLSQIEPLCQNRDYFFYIGVDSLSGYRTFSAVEKKSGIKHVLEGQALMYTTYNQCVCNDSTLEVLTDGVFIYLLTYKMQNGKWTDNHRVTEIATNDWLLRGSFADGEESVRYEAKLVEPGVTKVTEVTQKFNLKKQRDNFEIIKKTDRLVKVVDLLKE